MPCANMLSPWRNGSATRWVAITAPIGAYADDRPLAVVTMSGRMSYFSEPNQAPRRPQALITSSAHSRMPCSSQISRTPWK